MLMELKGAAILKGRGRKPASQDAIVDVLLKIGEKTACCCVSPRFQEAISIR